MNMSPQFEFNPDNVHISLDFETASIANNAAIAQIGACVIDPGAAMFNQAMQRQIFAAHVSVESCERAGLVVDKETLAWWDKQDPQLRARVFSGTMEIGEALSAFQNWCAQLVEAKKGTIKKNLFIWSNGADFDCVILKSAYELFDTYPFNFRNHRCYRTVRAISGMEFLGIVNEGKHDALHDAVYQARILERIMITRGLV